MVTLKINNSKTELIASEDISFGATIFSCIWSEQETQNSFYIPKTEIKINSQNYINTNDLFIPVTLSGFGEYIKINPKNPNTKAIIDLTNKQVNFIAIKNIKKNDLLSYTVDSSIFSNVTIQ